MGEKTSVVISGILGALLGSLSTYFSGVLTYKAKIRELNNSNWLSLVKEYNEMNNTLREQIDKLNERINNLEDENRKLREVMKEHGIV